MFVVSSEYISCKTGNNAVEMSQVFHDITRFERFTDLNLFTGKYGFNVIHINWEQMLNNFI